MRDGDFHIASSERGRRELFLVLIATVTAAITLAWYRPQLLRADEAALGKGMHVHYESWKGNPITLTSVKSLHDAEAEIRGWKNGRESDRLVIWLGNSQLHTINQAAQNDHLAPYWLSKDLSVKCASTALGLSLPNASLQEHYVVAQWVLERTSVNGLILPLVFDDLRESGLRDEFDLILDPELRRKLGDTSIGHGMLAAFDRERGPGQVNNREPLAGFMYAPVERWLDGELSGVLPMWGERAAFRSQLLLHLYLARNVLFGIKATTVRRMIPQRKELNLLALKALLAEAGARGVPVLMYIAPIRQDVSLPYDMSEYRNFIRDMRALAQSNNLSFLDLETLVPAPLWGTHVQGDIDFMHFRGEGHRLLADAVAPAVFRMIGCQ